MRVWLVRAGIVVMGTHLYNNIMFRAAAVVRAIAV